MVKYPDLTMRHYFAVMKPNEYIPCFSMFTVLELRKRGDVYRRFLETFSIFPCLILKSLDQLFQDELNTYPDYAKVSPILISSPGALSPKNQKFADILDLAFSKPEIHIEEEKWNSEKKSMLDGMLSLVKSYPPQGKSYTSNEIRRFIEIAGFRQIALRAPEFVQRIVKEGKTVTVDFFPSIKMITYTVFYKFYTDQRRPLESDPFDIIISSGVPYVDAVFTEKHQAEVLKKIKQQDKFIENLEVKRLRDFQ